MYTETLVTLDKGEDHKYNIDEKATKLVGINLKLRMQKRTHGPTPTLAGSKFCILLQGKTINWDRHEKGEEHKQ